MSLTATIFDISKTALHDGPGIRSTIYFKGCNLSCLWCHNPESHSPKPEISFAAQKCIQCGSCSAICPEHHILSKDGVAFLRDGCRVCGACVDHCYTKALSVVGKQYTPEEVLREILRDKAYYVRSGGGVTLSGGECLLYPEFAASVLRLCKENGIHTLIESAFCVPKANIEMVLPYTDMFYVDLKHFDSHTHKTYTGQGNALILENIRHFANVHGHLTVRTPLIPGVNDDMHNLEQTASFARQVGARCLELLKFNPLGASKYILIGKQPAPLAGVAQSREDMESTCQKLNQFLGETGFVYYS